MVSGERGTGGRLGRAPEGNVRNGGNHSLRSARPMTPAARTVATRLIASCSREYLHRAPTVAGQKTYPPERGQKEKQRWVHSPFVTPRRFGVSSGIRLILPERFYF
jgi:hypothetical protein